MAVTHDELDVAKAARLQAAQKLPPCARTFLARKLHAQHAPAPIVVDAKRDEHRLASYDAVLAHALVTRIEHEIGIRLLQRPLRKHAQLFIQACRQAADGAGRKLVPAKFFGNRLHATRRGTLHVHLDERRHQRFLAARITLEDLGREAPFAVLRHA